MGRAHPGRPDDAVLCERHAALDLDQRRNLLGDVPAIPAPTTTRSATSVPAIPKPSSPPAASSRAPASRPPGRGQPDVCESQSGLDSDLGQRQYGDLVARRGPGLVHAVRVLDGCRQLDPLSIIRPATTRILGQRAGLRLRPLLYRLVYASTSSGVLPYVKSTGYFDLVTNGGQQHHGARTPEPHFNQQYGPARIHAGDAAGEFGRGLVELPEEQRRRHGAVLLHRGRHGIHGRSVRQRRA